MFPGTKNRNEGVNADVPRYQKPERGYIRQSRPFTKLDTEYDRAKVPPYNGNDPPPAPGSLKALLFPPLLNNVENKGRKGYERGTARNFLQSFPLSGASVVQSYWAWRNQPFVSQMDLLSAHTPQIWGVTISPLNLGGELGREHCKTRGFGHSTP